MTNQEKATKSMTYLLDMLVDLTAQMSTTTDSDLVVEFMPILNDLTTNVKRIGDTLVLEEDADVDMQKASIDKTVKDDIEVNHQDDEIEVKLPKRGRPKKTDDKSSNNKKKVNTKNVNK
jgi:hypothetical protein